MQAQSIPLGMSPSRVSAAPHVVVHGPPRPLASNLGTGNMGAAFRCKQNPILQSSRQPGLSCGHGDQWTPLKLPETGVKSQLRFKHDRLVCKAHAEAIADVDCQVSETTLQGKSTLTLSAAPSPATLASEQGAANKALIKLTAVLLGWICMAGSFFRSVPQIVRIWREKSSEGLSITSVVAELLCYTINVAYHVTKQYDFSAYGEIFSCWVQDIALIGLMLWYMRASSVVSLVSLAGFAALSAWMFTGGMPTQMLAVMQVSTIFIMAFGSRLPQIMLNIKRGNTGVMSLLTCGLNVSGNIIRIFTTLVLTHDKLILFGACTQLMLNAVLLSQAVLTKLDKDRRLLDGEEGGEPSPSTA